MGAAKWMEPPGGGGKCADSTSVRAAASRSGSPDDRVMATDETAPEGPMGRGPVDGYAQYGGGKAIATAHGLGGSGQVPVEVGLAKRAAHYVGHLWDLHHCFDPRCAMHPGWSPGFAQYPEVVLCLFDREKSERKIKLGSG